MNTDAMREERFDRAEEVLGEWLAQRDAGGEDSFTILVAQHADLGPELRELAAGLGLYDQVLADGRQLVAENRAAIAEMLAGLGNGKDFGERYAIEGEVGKGGMGAVFRVLDRRLGRSLAMKVILGQADASRTGKTPEVSTHELQRFLNEARITGELKHPGIVPVHELGVDAHGRAFFTMQLVNGRTLGDVLKLQAEGHPDWSRARVLQVIQRVCEAMAYAHERGIVHRDLKPQNIMVGEFGGAYVMDWGVARRVGDAQEPVGRAAAAAADQALSEKLQLTRHGDVLGTPAYMPPEQAAGRLDAIGERSDVYAVGAMLYETLAGHAPYLTPGHGWHREELLRRIVAAPPARLDRQQGPAELIAICERAMAHDSLQRYPNVGELAADLGALLEHRVVKAYATGPWAELKKWMQRNKALTVSAVSAVVVLVAGIIVTSWLAHTNASLAQEKTDLAASELAARVRVQQQASEIAAAMRKFEEVSGVVQYERVMREEEKLYPGWPNQVAGMDVWTVEADKLLAQENELRNTVDTLRKKALPMTEEEIEAALSSHERFREYDSLRSSVAAMRTAQEVRRGRAAWVEPELPAELKDKSLAECNAIAWSLVDIENRARTFGQERLALACARRAFEGATDASERAEFGRTLAWALFFCGRDDEALEQARKSVALAGKRQAEFEWAASTIQGLVDLMQTSRGDESIATYEQKLQSLRNELRPWRIGGSTEDDAAAFLLRALTDLLKNFEELKKRKAGVLQRRAWAEQLVKLTLKHDWVAIRNAIAGNKLYDGCDIPLRDDADVRQWWLGLAPIGENPITHYWEFYDLRSAWNGKDDPDDIVVPGFEADGSIKVNDATGIVFVLLPGGSVTVGSQDSNAAAAFFDAKRQSVEVLHKVVLSPFLLARHEMTQGQWARLWTWDESLREPSYYKAGKLVGEERISLVHPVEHVSWPMCDDVLGRHGMVLPTEAQWEYGCRGGTTTPWITDFGQLKTVANLSDASRADVAGSGGNKAMYEKWRDGYCVHAPVGKLAANNFGLYDVHGNVSEWCRDWLQDYGSERNGDGLGAENNALGHRSYRGGHYALWAAAAKSAFRMGYEPSVRSYTIGVRPARHLH